MLEDKTMCLWKKALKHELSTDFHEVHNMIELYNCNNCKGTPPNVCPNYMNNVLYDGFKEGYKI